MKNVKKLFCLLFIFCLVFSSCVFATGDNTLEMETNTDVEEVLSENLTSSSGMVFDQSKETSIDLGEIEDLDEISEAEFTGVEGISGIDITDDSIFDFDSYYKNYNTTSKEIINKDIFSVGSLGGAELSNDQTEEKDVKVDKEIDGNVYLIAGKIEINETIEGNVFAIGEEVRINSSIEGSVYVIGSTVTLTEEADIYGSAHIVSQNFMMLSGEEYDSVIDKDLYLVSESATLSGSVQRNMNVMVKDITFDSSFYLGNEDDIESSHILYRDSYTNNSGIESLNSIAEKQEEPTEVSPGARYYVVKYVLSFFVGLVVVLAIVFFEKNTKFKISENTSIEISAASNFVTGLVFAVLALILAVLLCISGIGILLGVVLLLIYLLMMCLAVPVFSVVVAKKIIKKPNYLSIVLIASLICLVLDLLKLVPILGMVLNFIVFVFGTGTIINSFKNEKNNDKESEKLTAQEDNTLEEIQMIKKKKMLMKKIKNK